MINLTPHSPLASSSRHRAEARKVGSCTSPTCTCVVCGGESVGKTQLLASLTGKLPFPENFRGSTIACETYRDGEIAWTDTPGILRESESSASRSAMAQVVDSDRVMLVARADRAAEELPALLPSIAGKRGFIALTFQDRLDPEHQVQTKELSERLGVPVFLLNARQLQAQQADAIRAVASAPSSTLGRFPESLPAQLDLPAPSKDQRESLLERASSQPLVALLLLFAPAVVSMIYTNRFANWLYDPLATLLEPGLTMVAAWPSLPSALFGGNYGLLAMLPFLILYAVPTILSFSLMLAVYKSSGLIDRISLAVHPWLRPFGIGGRDLVRVVMGFGCKVPAIVSSRSCHSCSRGACVSAISFGSACSYQLPATLAVFAAAGMTGMGVVYLIVLALTTLVYLRFTTPKILRLASNQLILTKPDSLAPPSWRSVLREVASSLKSFVVMAFPVFIVICLAAALLDWLGVLHGLSKLLAPMLAIFHLPGEAAPAVILGSIRKDGIAIGLLDSTSGSLKVALSTPAQVLTTVYLAGVLLPCLVTVFTIIREMRWKFAAKLCARQMAWASGFALIIAWGGALIF
ncbi:nucleoside recognition domain-containing protein [Oceaniferula flava]|uniref:nucleoside recognition domain-containing protein n=1 Tax=Oceaniferula flava TaxID=2800421 RepID=UPI002867F940|nr:nucleoside recognition domain-containing protein [Oceaniferula flavus]